MAQKKRLRRRLERQARRSGLQVDHDSFADQRNQYNFKLFQAKTSFYRSKIVDAPPADKWKFCNKLFGKSKSSALPSHVSELSLSNSFNDFFTEKITKIRNDLQSNPLPYPPHLSDALPEFSGELLSDFQPVNDKEVEKVLLSSLMHLVHWILYQPGCSNNVWWHSFPSSLSL